MNPTSVGAWLIERILIGLGAILGASVLVLLIILCFRLILWAVLG